MCIDVNIFIRGLMYFLLMYFLEFCFTHVWPHRDNYRLYVSIRDKFFFLCLSTKHNSCVAVCCSVLQCGAVCCSVLQCVAVCCSALQSVAVCCSVLQCVAVRCSALQCVAVRCSALQCVAVCIQEGLSTKQISREKQRRLFLKIRDVFPLICECFSIELFVLWKQPRSWSYRQSPRILYICIYIYICIY